MTQTSYMRESNHERKIMHDYQKLGYQCTRAAGSHGLADVICWNDKEVLFIASQSVEWSEKKMELLWRSFIRPPSSLLKFYSKLNSKEVIEDADELAHKHNWIINPVSNELLEFARKRNWKWVKCIR